MGKNKTDAENQEVLEEKKEQEATVDPRDEEIKKLEEELSKLHDSHLRTLAEYDNYRKRTEKEKLEIYTNATVAAAAMIVPIADNIERALGAADSDEQSMKKGVEMIYSQLKEAFEKLGIEENYIRIYAQGINQQKIDVTKNDLVTTYHDAKFEPQNIKVLILTNKKRKF